MKMVYDEKAAAERMKRGVLTSLGFLGTDARPLVDIIQADEEMFRALGLDFGEAADRLDALARSGSAGLGEPITLDGGWLVKSDESRGKLPCPYGDGLFHKNSVTLQRDGDILVYSDLSIHLLRVHHFCQGIGNPFRLDPVVLKRVLHP
jgi:hypothetical protein